MTANKSAIKRACIAGIGVAVLLVMSACGGAPSDIRTTQGLPVAPTVSANAGATQAAPGGLASPQQAGNSAYPNIAYPWYAPVSSQTGLTVMGFGQASTAPDSAVVTIFLGPQVVAVPGGAPSSGPIQPPGATPVSDTSVQAVVDAIKGQSVSASDITVNRAGGSATITVTVRHLDTLSGIEQAATQAADAQHLTSSTSVTYSVTDCASLEQAALKAATSDASTRVSVLAHALNVGVGSLRGSAYTVSPAPGANGCESGGVVPYPLVNGATGAATAAPVPDVQIDATVTVTYAIK